LDNQSNIRYIGFDIGSSSVKASLVDAKTAMVVATVQEPANEMQIISTKTDWAEQDPELWWQHVCKATKRLLSENGLKAKQIKGIGIAYQMHGLVAVDRAGKVVRNSIIWCDSRAVGLGESAFAKIGEERCLEHLLNSPANFTASKLAWVKQHEPEWDFKNSEPSAMVLDHYKIAKNLIPDLVETFGIQGNVSEKGAQESGLLKGTPILYRAGDQPNNALSLNVFQPGEVAATGGTSGVLYAVTDSLKATEGVKLNNFAHVNHTKAAPRIGKLLCINGAGIQYRWLKDTLSLSENSYKVMNSHASKVPVGADNLQLIPFGNGAERMFDNCTIGSHICNLNLNTHNQGHILRAALEGIAFAFVYGMEVLKKDHTEIKVIRAGNDNLFRSRIFSETVATLIDRAAGKADGILDFGAAVAQNDYVESFEPNQQKLEYVQAYENWLSALDPLMNEFQKNTDDNN